MCLVILSLGVSEYNADILRFITTSVINAHHNYLTSSVGGGERGSRETANLCGGEGGVA